jgi:hypothetical protein
MVAHVGSNVHHPSICESVAAVKPNVASLLNQVYCRAKLIGQQICDEPAELNTRVT